MEKRRRQFEGDDPGLTELCIGKTWRSRYVPQDGDWGRDGRGVGGNTHIRELCFCSDMVADRDVSREQLEAFCKGLSRNRSIEQLGVYCSTLFDGDIFTMLSPFFEWNGSLRCLTVHCHTNTPNSVRRLSEALSRFASLKEFECSGNRFRDSEVEALVRALAGHPGLSRIDLNMNEVGEGGIATLGALLNRPNPSLADLQLMQAGLNDDRTVALAADLTDSVALKRLNLAQNPRITVTGWSAIFTMLQSPLSSLEDLSLYRNSINDDAANLLAGALGDGAPLKRLVVSEISAITVDGWRAVFAALRGPSCMLEHLLLNSNSINDEAVADLSNSLANNRTLKHLHLNDNSAVTPSGWRAFSVVFLGGSVLETVELADNSIDDDALAQFADSLTGNDRLRRLLLDPVDETTEWDALVDLLCNVSSILDTFASNHTLGGIFHSDDSMFEQAEATKLPRILGTLLRLNREGSPREAARLKIIRVHFGGAFDMQPFVDMDLGVLPRAIAWMARDEHGASMLYQYVRNASIFVDVGGAAEPENDSRPKRQKV